MDKINRLAVLRQSCAMILCGLETDLDILTESQKLGLRGKSPKEILGESTTMLYFLERAHKQTQLAKLLGL
jgi:hypothetical protein